MLSGTLAACTNNTNDSNKTEKSNSDLVSSSEQTSLNSETKESKNTIWLKEKSQYQFEANEGTNEYLVFIYAEDEQSLLNGDKSQGGKNQLYTGHYSIYLAEKDSAIAYKQIDLGEGESASFIFNYSSNQAYSINLGKNTIFAVFQYSEHGNSKPFLYTIKDGEIQKINTQGNLATIFGTEIKNINQQYLQTAHLQENKVWKFTTWEYDEGTLTIKKKDESVMNEQAEGLGEYWYNLWSEKKEFYYPFLNLELSSDVVEKAKQGIPLGSPYPLGTNISNIKKSEPNYMEEGITNETPYLMYPEITYYYDQESGAVTAVSIPGERVKTTIVKIKELLGKPEHEERHSDGGTRLIYNADKYAVEILSAESGEVESIYLRKK